ncbi:deubiquitinating protein VCPIP1-like [Rhodnius prolixus]
MWIGTCKDELCRQVLLFPECVPYVTCHQCGQTHRTELLDNKSPFNKSLSSNPHILKTPYDKLNLPTRGPELIKVMGYSHYQQKLVSHLLTKHGMDKHTGKARPLQQITGGVTLDCSVFGDRSFKIETRHIDITGFGKDVAANEYLAETIKIITSFNDNLNSLIPIHADGDGHCLVHAISRAVSGRELFWHPLRIGLKQHFSSNMEKYKSLLGNFINNAEWSYIIDECDPDYKPSDGSMVGLRNVHVFGLANLLRRPIILLDSIEGMKASADYAAVFLPGLNPTMTCCNKNGSLNSPICLAWSSAARNHYIPLVPVKELPLPKLRRSFLPKVWGFPQDLIDSYMKFDDLNCVTIGGDDHLAQPYLNKLNMAMDELFTCKKRVAPQIIADLFHYHYSTKLVNPPKPEAVLEAAVTTLQERRLLRCILCQALCVVPLSSHSLRPGGALYVAAKKKFGFLREDYDYTFRNYRIVYRYDSSLDILVVHSIDPAEPCSFCNNRSLRKIRDDGSVIYQNGDNTTIPVSNVKKSNCPCGFKHWWDRNYFDNLPTFHKICIPWKGDFINETFPWFSEERDPVLNSDVYEVAANIIQKIFSEVDRTDSLMEMVVALVREATKESSRLVDEEENRPLEEETLLQQTSGNSGRYSPGGNKMYGESSTSQSCYETSSFHRDNVSVSPSHSRSCIDTISERAGLAVPLLEEETSGTRSGTKRSSSTGLRESPKRIALSENKNRSPSPNSPKPSTSRH